MEDRARGGSRYFHAWAYVFKIAHHFFSRSAKLGAESPLAVNLFSVATVNGVKQLDELGVVKGQVIAAATSYNPWSLGAVHFQDVKSL